MKRILLLLNILFLTFNVFGYKHKNSWCRDIQKRNTFNYHQNLYQLNRGYGIYSKVSISDVIQADHNDTISYNPTNDTDVVDLLVTLGRLRRKEITSSPFFTATKVNHIFLTTRRLEKILDRAYVKK